MTNLFDIIDISESGEKQIPAGVILRVHFDEGYCGVIDIYQHAGAELSRIKGSGRVNIHLQGKNWVGGFENAKYHYKNEQPFNRGSQATYIPTSFSNLDTLLTSDGGRFFSEKRTHETNISFSVDDHKDREEAAFFAEGAIGELSQYLGYILPKMGVPQENVRPVVEDIFKKFGYSEIGIIDTLVKVPVRKKEEPSVGNALTEELVNKRGQTTEAKINDFYQNVMGISMAVSLSPIEVKTAVNEYLETAVNGIKESYESIEHGELSTAYQALQKAGEAMQSVASIVDENLPKKVPKVGMSMHTSHFMLEDLGGLRDIDMSKLNKEVVLGKGGIIDTYQNWILPKLNKD